MNKCTKNTYLLNTYFFLLIFYYLYYSNGVSLCLCHCFSQDAVTYRRTCMQGKAARSSGLLASNCAVAKKQCLSSPYSQAPFFQCQKSSATWSSPRSMPFNIKKTFINRVVYTHQHSWGALYWPFMLNVGMWWDMTQIHVCTFPGGMCFMKGPLLSGVHAHIFKNCKCFLVYTIFGFCTHTLSVWVLCTAP